ncbi:MAG: undecaprenyldiphospho-muramoylpentapeptide beta-N-acetylglucosaminyltransferase [Clostridia bacterium]|nr:undecaprenyldiphospho-muramoylpentapeptide beta-N-acetylglucosaminyltransferase [Clostridia bacterium]
MRAIIACAGTGGHINPGIAIAKIIEKEEKNSEILFIGTKTGIENELVKKAGYRIEHTKTGKFYRSLTLKNIKSIIDIFAGIKESKEIIKKFKAEIVIGTGGYICMPVMLAARSLKIPYVLHESNAYPGIAVKFLTKKASKVLVGFEDTKKRLKRKENIIYTGSPAKFNEADIDKMDKKKCIEDLGILEFSKDRKIIFVTGGSQGAKKFNETIIKIALEKKSDEFFIVLATGMKNYDDVMNKISDKKEAEQYIKIEKFVFEMDKMYKASDLLITRSGAMTITELSIAKRPAILIPFPYATENHQYYNAKALEDIGAAKIIIEDNLTEELLYKTINELISDNNKLLEMGQNAGKLQKKNVEELIYKEIKETVKG